MNIDELTLRRVETALLDCDGSCRDISFTEDISTSAAIDVLAYLALSWTMVRSITSEGDEIANAELLAYLRKTYGSISTAWNGGNNPEHIQAYFHWDEPEKVFCEITFSPQDIHSETFNILDFLSTLSKLTLAACSTEYYVRYEDASWRQGQHEKESVILSHS